MSNELIAQLALRSGASVEQCVGIARDFRYGFYSTAQLEAFAKAYQATAPIDNVAEALEKAAKLCEQMQREKNGSFVGRPCTHGTCEISGHIFAESIRTLITDTQAKKGE
jgi:hypothetical protein